jgi:hypothetical protein
LRATHEVPPSEEQKKLTTNRIRNGTNVEMLVVDDKNIFIQQRKHFGH